MTKEAWLACLELEHLHIKMKIALLREFIDDSVEFVKLTDNRQHVLERQIVVMQEYCDILDSRVEDAHGDSNRG